MIYTITPHFSAFSTMNMDYIIFQSKHNITSHIIFGDLFNPTPFKKSINEKKFQKIKENHRSSHMNYDIFSIMNTIPQYK